jgi:hypothetical protein
MLRKTMTSRIGGSAPVLYFANTKPAAPKDEQVRKNTAIAIEMIKRFKGPAPAPYTRKYKQTIEQIQGEIDALVGGVAKIARRKVTDDQPMDKLTLLERCLRHGLQMYLKDEGKGDYAEMAKWLVYTPNDESKLALLKREQELKQKAAAFKAKRIEGGGAQTQLPNIDWAQEYAQAIDREIVTEKRIRYDALAVNSTDRDEKAVEAVLEQYRRPVQDKRLDDLVEMLERFKPVLAREAIMQRLTIKHLEGQLGVWRYMDWNPEVRDRAELEADNYAYQWWLEFEEKRLLGVRLRSLNEAKANAEKVQEAESAKQAAVKAASGASATSGGSDANAQRDKLLREVLALQARIGKRDDAEEKKEEKKPAAAHH